MCSAHLLLQHPNVRQELMMVLVTETATVHTCFCLCTLHPVISAGGTGWGGGGVASTWASHAKALLPNLAGWRPLAALYRWWLALPPVLRPVYQCAQQEVMATTVLCASINIFSLKSELESTCEVTGGGLNEWQRQRVKFYGAFWNTAIQ